GAAAVPRARLWHHDGLAAERVRARHLVGVIVAFGQWMQRRPYAQILAADQHRVLDAELPAARKDNLTGAGAEVLRTACPQPLDPPVLGIERGTAEIEVPVATRRHIQRRPLQ